MLRLLINTFMRHGHHLTAPQQIVDDSRCFILENDHVREFMSSNYEAVDDYSSFVPLNAIIAAIKHDSVYKLLIPVNKASGIGQKIGNIGYEKRLLDGKVVFRNLKERFPFVRAPGDGSQGCPMEVYASDN